MRVRTLKTTTTLNSVGTIRGGSFLSLALALSRFRLWSLRASTLPSLP